jgi:hypothetical protein
MIEDPYRRMQISLENPFFQDRCHQNFGNQYSFHALCLSRGQRAPYSGRGGQISNKRRCIDNGGALWGTSRVRVAPTYKATLLEGLAAIAYPFYPWNKPRALLWELGA